MGLRLDQLPAKVARAAADIFASMQAGVTRQITLQDIADWVVQSAASFLQSGTGAAATDLQTRGRLVVYANDYGTKMVTTPGADINLAISAVTVAGGGKVIVPGNYTIETTILHKSNVELVIEGTLTAHASLAAQILKNATSVTTLSVSGITNAGRTATVTTGTAHGYVAGDWVHIYGASPDGYNGWHKVIATPLSTTFTFYVDKNIAADSGTISVFKYVESNLKISGGGKLVGTSANTYGIHYHGVKDFELTSITVDGTNNNGVFIETGVSGKLCKVQGNNVISATHNGILLGTTDRYVENIEMVLCEGNNNGQDGILLERGRIIHLFGCGGKYNSLAAIKIGKVSDVKNIGGFGRYNQTGCQVQPSGTGSKAISILHGDYCENTDSGIYVTNTDTSNPLVGLDIIGNNCHRNGQVGSTTSYGVALDPSASATIDRVNISHNQCDDQTRGLSIGANGTVSNATIVGNRCKGNTNDANFGAALQTSTAIYALNAFANTGGNGVILPAVTTASFAQIAGKSSAKLTAPLDTSTNTLATVTIPAGALGTGGQLIIECEFTFTNSANNKTLTIQFDGNSMSNVVDTNQLTSYVRILIQNDGAANAQRYSVFRLDGSTTTVGSSTLTVDTSASKDITFKVTKATGAESVILERYSVVALVNS